MNTKRMSALMYMQTSCNTGGKFTCLRCLCHFTYERTLAAHIPECIAVHDGESKVKMPKAGSVVKFTNLYKQNPVNYTIYEDFECIMDKTFQTLYFYDGGIKKLN